jgi:hypothetical protein
MKASWYHDGAVWQLGLALHPEDPVTGSGQGSMQVGLLAREATIRLPFEVSEPHPDLAALAALVIARPWTARRLHLDRGVSRQFAATVHEVLRVDVGPVDDSLPGRRSGPTPVLAYSAGYDSVAASQVLPDGTPHVHHRRVAHPRVPHRATHWRADAFEGLVHRTGQRGRNVHVVRTDFEYLCHPYPTLPHWFGFAVGPLLMADHFNGGTIAMGGTLETFYMDMGRRWTGDRPAARGIDDLPAAVGMPITRPVLGLTEIITMQLAAASDLADLARACVSGTYTAPCGVCPKCVRKTLIAAAVGARDTVPRWTKETPGLQSMSGEPPYYMHAQLEFAVSRVRRRGPLKQLYRRLGEPEPDRTEWMRRAYRPAVKRGVPAQWRQPVADAIGRHVGWMTDGDVAAAAGWAPLPEPFCVTG